jgi:two-component system KDP operon response regulator KdpE
MWHPSVLCISPNVAIRRLVRRSLATGGVRVHDAATLEPRALDSVAAVILDDEPGAHACATTLESLHRASPLPVVVLASSDEQGIAALDACADDYIVKPFAEDELAARVRKAMKNHERNQTLARPMTPHS